VRFDVYQFIGLDTPGMKGPAGGFQGGAGVPLGSIRTGWTGFPTSS
jgi:hypothetical protein